MVNISVVVPVYNENDNIPKLIKELLSVLNQISSKFEIIFVNDGSTDNSLVTLKKLRRRNSHIKIISFSRNFGHTSAIIAGLKTVSGKKVVIMDADLQDPPAVIKSFYQKSHDGYDVIYGVKIKRKENIVKKTLFNIFYRILDFITFYKMPYNAGTFCMIDSKIVNILNSIPEKNKYFSGLRAWTGFRQTGVVYERAKRYAGKSKSLGKLISMGLDAVFSFSYIPLRLATYAGFLFALLAFFFIIVILILRFILGFGIIGWASTISAILLIGGVQLITLGIIGEYIARIYDEVKGRPEYIISEKIGFK